MYKVGVRRRAGSQRKDKTRRGRRLEAYIRKKT